MSEKEFNYELDRRVQELYDKYKEDKVLEKIEEGQEEDVLSPTNMLETWDKKEQEWQNIAKNMDIVMEMETEKLWDLEKKKYTQAQPAKDSQTEEEKQLQKKRKLEQ